MIIIGLITTMYMPPSVA